MYTYQFIFITLQLIFLTQIKYGWTSGSVALNERTFDKIIRKFPVTLVKFDVAFPYGDKQEIFKQLSVDTSKNQDLLLAEVGVKDYGDSENENLAKKFNVKKEDFPVLKLFVQDQTEPIDFPKSRAYTSENIKTFIRENTNIYIGLPGCLEEFDKLAASFIKAKKDKRPNIVKKVDKDLSSLNDEDKKTAKVYLTVMKKVVDSGDEFIGKELKRLEKLLQEKITPRKKTELTERHNVLLSFRTSTKDEL